ncbi:MAG TPA: SurA N-terminal domain-containing protein [Acidobacteriota bacterium]|nr:SurA N-terminal domain-containing protein [Acidobacteriota bacterium]
MLKTMRKNVKSLKPILWIIVATFIVAIFAIWGAGGGALGKASRTDTVATIAGERVTSDEYLQAMRQRLEAIKEQFGGELNANLIQQMGLPQQVLSQLVNSRLLLHIAKDMGVRGTDQEVDQRIRENFSQDGQFIGKGQYIEYLQRYYHQTPAAFEQNVRNGITIEKAIRLLTAGVFVTDDEVWRNYQKQNDSAKIEYLVSETAKSEVKGEPSEAELRAHFDKDPAAYKIPEKRTGDYVVLKTDDLKKEVTVKDAEIAKYYKDNPAQFQDPEKVQASRIWMPFTAADKDAVLARARDVQKRAAGGADFAALAREFSKDDKAALGGDWGLYDWRSLSAAETGAVGRLDKGGVSDVVETETGAALFKVTDKVAAVTRPLAESSATIKGILEDQKARALVAERIGRLERSALKERSLDFAAQKESLKPASTGALKRGDALGDFDASGAVSEALFGLKEKEISAPIFTATGEALAELKTIEPERPAKFEEVRAEVAKDLLEVRKKAQAEARLKEAEAKLKDDWNAEASKLQLQYKTVDAHKREQYLSLVGERPAVDDLVFTLPIKQISAPVAVEEGFAIFRVLERKMATREEFDKVRATEKSTLLEDKKNRFLTSYLALAQDRFKYRPNVEVFFQLTQDVLSRYQQTP